MKPITDISFDSLFNQDVEREISGGELMVVEATGAQSSSMNVSVLPARFDAYSILLVVRGELMITIDYKTHSIKKNSLVELFSYHVIDNIRVSPDYKSYHIFIGRDLFNLIMDHTGLMAREHLHDERFQLIRPVEENEMSDLLRILERIRSYIADKEYVLGHKMVRSELSTFMIEYSNICLKHANIRPVKTYESEQKEDIVSRFVKLLIENCTKESEVSFYSTELCITPEHLSRVMKSMSGKPVNIWIQEARITEAKILLRRPETTIQQVAEELAFSDQSSFGKFFKKHTGKSPLEYRRETMLQ